MSNSLTIRIHSHEPGFLPGGNLSGEISWEAFSEVRSISVRLFWFTSGRGDQTLEITDSKTLETPAVRGSYPFEFPLPAEPWSFSGSLISLTWALEAVVEPGGHSERQEFVLSPSREVIVLRPVDGDG